MSLADVLRTLITSIVAAATALTNVARNGGRLDRIALHPGDTAPDFELEGSDGRTYRLSALKGQAVVLAWFPKAFTGGCTAQCRSIEANSKVLRQQSARFFGVSVDIPKTNRDFATSLGLDYPILSDPDRSTARAYGVLNASGFASRWTFYIGADGRILAIDKQVRPSTHGQDIEGMLAGLHGRTS